MQSFKNRLKQAMDAKGITQSELSRRSHIGRNSISDYLKGKYEAKQDKVYSLAHALDVDEAWLMGYDVQKSANVPDDIDSIYRQLNSNRKRNVYDYAKHQLDEQNNVRSDESVIGLKEIPRGADEIFMINDDSMSAKIEPQSTVFIHYQPALDFDGEIMLVDVDGEGVTCRKVFCNKETDRLVALNPKYEDRIIPHENVHIIGKVIF